MPLIIHREKPEPDRLIVLGQAPIVKEQAAAMPIPDEPITQEEAPTPKRGRPPKNKETE